MPAWRRHSHRHRQGDGRGARIAADGTRAARRLARDALRALPHAPRAAGHLRRGLRALLARPRARGKDARAAAAEGRGPHAARRIRRTARRGDVAPRRPQAPARAASGSHRRCDAHVRGLGAPAADGLREDDARRNGTRRGRSWRACACRCPTCARAAIGAPRAAPRSISPRPCGRMARSGGDITKIARRRPGHHPPPLVVLCDISGSMHRYTRMFLHFLHALTRDRQRVTTLVFGTRLTNVTRPLRDRDVDEALARVCEAVPDWAGGTRIAACLHEFNFRWARRLLGQNACVLLVTDGLERDDTGRSARRWSASPASCASPRVAQSAAALRRLRAERLGNRLHASARRRVPARAQPRIACRSRAGAFVTRDSLECRFRTSKDT